MDAVIHLPQIIKTIPSFTIIFHNIFLPDHTLLLNPMNTVSLYINTDNPGSLSLNIRSFRYRRKLEIMILWYNKFKTVKSKIFRKLDNIHRTLPVVFLLHQMVPCSKCDQVGVIGRSRYGNASRASHVCVAQLIC